MKDIFHFNSKVKSFQDVFFDSHCHVQFKELDDEPIESIVGKAQTAGLNKLVLIGIDEASSQAAIDIQGQFPGYCYATLGNHPYNADQDCKFILEKLEQYSDAIVAIGETGLDYFKNKLAKDIQIESFYNHCEIAKRYDLPVIVHLREFKDCIEDCLSIINQVGVSKVIFHCYTGDMSYAKKLWERGFKTSFALITFYPKNGDLLEVYKRCPLQNLLIETDSPYLPPQSHRGKVNKPYYLEEFLRLRT